MDKVVNTLDLSHSVPAVDRLDELIAKFIPLSDIRPLMIDGRLIYPEPEQRGYITRSPYGILLWKRKPTMEDFIYDAFWVYKKDPYKGGHCQPGFVGADGDHIHIVTNKIPSWMERPRQYWSVISIRLRKEVM